MHKVPWPNIGYINAIVLGVLKDVTYDDSDDAKNSATKYLMDADIYIQETLVLLRAIAGVTDSK